MHLGVAVAGVAAASVNAEVTKENPLALLASCKSGFLTTTACGPQVAVRAGNIQRICVEETTLTSPQSTPPIVTDAPGVKFLPARTSGVAATFLPNAGVTLSKLGVWQYGGAVGIIVVMLLLALTLAGVKTPAGMTPVVDP